MPSESLLRCLLLGLLVLPTVGAVVVAALGPRRLDAIRWVSLAVTLAVLLSAVVLAIDFAGRERGPEAATGVATFRPVVVPGDPGETHTTSWTLLTIPGANEAPGVPASVRFYVGLDGLNVWLIVLTAFLMVPAVLISWEAIRERANEYYAWMLALGTGMLGVFLAFDLVLFYAFFELTLVPLFFLIGIWGGPQRQHAARKFFIYTLTGSLVTLLGVLGVALAFYVTQGRLTFSIPLLVEWVNNRLLAAQASAAELAYWRSVQFWVFLALIAGFAIKVPLFPLHTWLPLAHVEAPTAGSVILAGVLLKIGAYGFLRLCLPLTPDASLSVGVPLVGTLAVIGIIYGAFCALAQATPAGDVKKLVAYSSVSHLGFVMLGMFALNEAGLSGSLLQMINHGLSTGALFLLVGMLYERYHTRKIGDYGGMSARLRLLAVFMVFVVLTSVGLPGLNGFVGEVLVLFGIYDLKGSPVDGRLLATLAASGIVLGAWYLFTMLLRMFFGPVKEPAVHGAAEHGPVGDLNLRELAILVPIAVVCVAIGVYPEWLLGPARADIRVVSDIVRRAEERAGLVAPSAVSVADHPEGVGSQSRGSRSAPPDTE